MKSSATQAVVLLVVAVALLLVQWYRIYTLEESVTATQQLLAQRKQVRDMEFQMLSKRIEELERDEPNAKP